MNSKKYLIEMKGVSKSFPGVKALDKCEFNLLEGEVHALVGENGAGKSTMMKVLTGIYQRDEGTIKLNGEEAHFHNTKDAQKAGISIIHQELQLMNDLTVGENIFIGREPKKFFNIMIDDDKINEMSSALFDRLKISLNPKTKISDLTVAMQQMVEIAKALSHDAKVLIMDEPTAALTDSEIEHLFEIIKELKQNGVGIVYISHRMDELKQICDRVTVFRDGKYIDDKDMDKVTIDEVIKMMVGREVYIDQRGREIKNKEVVLEVKGLSRSNKVKDANFQLYKGEILGFAGLMGAGRTELARIIFGADKADSGEIFINGEKVHIKTPSQAVEKGIAYLSEDRKEYGLVLGLGVEENTVMSCLPEYTNGFILDRKKAAEKTQEMIDLLSTKTPSTSQLVKFLSGGNQQKVVIAKWLTRNSDILIFDEPTRGIDVGAKGEIYKLLDKLAKEGKSIIVISSELPEVLKVSDRIVVMSEGRITGELGIKEATQEKIMELATGR